MKISRKEFIWKAGMLCGGMYAGSLSAGCAASSKQISEVIEPNGGEVTIETKKLKNTGDRMILEIKNFDSKIILIKNGMNEYKALSLNCSHKGCELVVYNNFLECPCHGSEFDLKGSALKGPATEPLVNYKTKLNNDKTEITILINVYE